MYNHVAGDGRELVITDATACKLRAEDGRAVHQVNISTFIDNLPDGRDTHAFSTADASGSTSQAASTVEALEAGARTLLIDEDTSATNFMVRDALMEAVVAAEHEPITPFVERVRSLWERCGVSSVIVVGSSGAFFSAADAVVQMDRCEAHDITDRVREVCRERGVPTLDANTGEGSGGKTESRVEACESLDARAAAREAFAEGRRMRLTAGSHTEHRRRSGGKGGAAGKDARAERNALKVRAHGLDEFSVGAISVDVRQVEQLVDTEQVATLAQMMRVALELELLDGTRTLPDIVNAVYARLEKDGWRALSSRGEAACGLALPRKEELFACLNRWRME